MLPYAKTFSLPSIHLLIATAKQSILINQTKIWYCLRFALLVNRLLLTPVYQVSYAIGIAEPLSLSVFDYGTSKMNEKQLLRIINQNFDLRPGAIVK